jgi:hypothetical protein
MEPAGKACPPHARDEDCHPVAQVAAVNRFQPP